MTEKVEDQVKQDEPIKRGRQAKQDEPAKRDDGHLVAMSLDGETIKVHPSCVADHKRLGWVEA